MKAVMFHYVKKDIDPNSALNVLSFERFSKQLDYFEKIGRIIHPNELADPAASFDEHDFLLTFDDGLKDHYATVFPELNKRGLSALFFLNSVNFTSCRLLNVHRLHYLFHNFHGQQLIDDCEDVLKAYDIQTEYFQKFQHRTYVGLDQDAMVSSIKNAFNFYLPKHVQEEAVTQLFSRYVQDECSVAKAYYLSESEITKMVSENMCFGAHGKTHYVLSNLTVEQQKEEIESSFQFVSDFLPANALKVFCMPYGYRESYNDSTLQVLSQLNVSIGFSVENRPIDIIDLKEHRLHLPRLDCNRF